MMSLVTLFSVVLLGQSCQVLAGEAELEGRRQYESALAHSRAPRFGSCWTAALERLDRGCAALTDEEQARLALAFAACFLRQAGRGAAADAMSRCARTDETAEGAEDASVAHCLVGVGSEEFNAFTSFFTV